MCSCNITLGGEGGDVSTCGIAKNLRRRHNMVSAHITLGSEGGDVTTCGIAENPAQKA